MDSEIKGISFEKDENGNDRYVRFDLQRYANYLQPIFQKLGIHNAPEGWEEGLNSKEFLTEAKKLLRKKFDQKNKIS